MPVPARNLYDSAIVIDRGTTIIEIDQILRRIGAVERTKISVKNLFPGLRIEHPNIASILKNKAKIISRKLPRGILREAWLSNGGL
jgi:hypothetical protein